MTMETSVQEVQIIELKQLPIIAERLRSVKQDIEARTQDAMSLVCTEQSVKDIKKVRAELSKEFNALEEQRKEMKRQYMAPYDQFEALYKECITTPFKAADADLKAKVAEVENGVKREKERAVQDYFAELCAANRIDWLDWSRTGIKVNLSSSLKSLKEQARVFVEDIANSLDMIDTLENRDEVLVEYRDCLNTAVAIKRVNDRQAAIKAQRERDNARREQEAQRQAAAQQTIQAAEAQREKDDYQIQIPQAEAADPEQVQAEEEPTQEKIYGARFLARGTLEQLKKLKAFMESEGISYESI